jgi:hypothetical protein
MRCEKNEWLTAYPLQDDLEQPILSKCDGFIDSNHFRQK